jgi:hypothetical protein
MAFPKLLGELKLTLIDLEIQQWMTGRKREHRERLSELATQKVDAIVRTLT